MPSLSKEQRMKLFFAALRAAPAMGSFAEGYQLLVDTLNSIEDTHSGVPSDPSRWKDDGRLYPPQEDMAKPVEKFPEVIVFRNRAHRTFIATNGSILIWDISKGRMVVSKPGQDGVEVPQEALH